VNLLVLFTRNCHDARSYDLKGIGLDGEKWVHLAQERGGGGEDFFISYVTTGITKIELQELGKSPYPKKYPNL
jgi:hypothetical protein